MGVRGSDDSRGPMSALRLSSGHAARGDERQDAGQAAARILRAEADHRALVLGLEALAASPNAGTRGRPARPPTNSSQRGSEPGSISLTRTSDNGR